MKGADRSATIIAALPTVGDFAEIGSRAVAKAGRPRESFAEIDLPNYG